MNTARNDDPHDLSRFVSAQNGIYDRAIDELRAGRKQSHWMWFVFPQIDGLARSSTARFYAIKSLLEGYAARTACPSLTRQDIKRLEGLNAAMARCAEKNDVKGFFSLDNQFHDTFLKACGNDKLYALVHSLVEQFERFRVTALSLPGRMTESLSQHRDIIEAFTGSDALLVETLVRANAEKGRDVLVDEIQKDKAGQP